MQHLYQKDISQVCELKFQIYGGHDNWLLLKKESKGVEYKGKMIC